MTDEKEHCEYVKLVLERMKTNPDDFDMGTKLVGGGRFRAIAIDISNHARGGINNDLWMFTEEEQEALVEGFKTLKKEQMFQDAIKIIMGGQEQQQFGNSSMTLNGRIDDFTVEGFITPSTTYKSTLASNHHRQQAQNTMLNAVSTGSSWQSFDARDLFKDSK